MGLNSTTDQIVYIQWTWVWGVTRAGRMDREAQVSCGSRPCSNESDTTERTTELINQISKISLGIEKKTTVHGLTYKWNLKTKNTQNKKQIHRKRDQTCYQRQMGRGGLKECSQTTLLLLQLISPSLFL